MAVVVVLLAAAFVAGREVNDHDDPSSEATTTAAAGLGSQGFAQLPTVKCKTGLGVQQPAVPLDAKTVVAIPAADASGLAAYRNSAGTTLVAPSGFQCEAGIGVDGGEHVTVFPRGNRNPAEYPQRSGTVVTLNIARACQGCIAEAVCTYFPEAKPVDFYYGSIESQECPSKPLREEAAYAAKSTVIFYDPPNVELPGSVLGARLRRSVRSPMPKELECGRSAAPSPRVRPKSAPASLARPSLRCRSTRRSMK